MQRISRRNISKYLEDLTTLWVNNGDIDVDDGYLRIVDRMRIALGGDLITPRLI